MIDYRECPPDAILRGHVECLWSMRSRGCAAPETDEASIERVLPDGCVELVWHLGDPFRSFTPGGASRPQPRALVVGPSTGFLLIQPGRRIDTLGVRLRPGAARAILQVPLRELAETTAPLVDLLGGRADRLWEDLSAERDPGRRRRILEDVLRARLERPRPDPPGWRAAVRAALAGRGRAPVAALAREAGVGTRQLERTFLSELGLRPKSFLRLLRFQGVFAALPRGRPVDWATLALDCGYADQSHLIRDFRSFSGETPSSLLRDEGSLSRHFTSPERLRAFFGADPPTSRSSYPDVRPAR